MASEAPSLTSLIVPGERRFLTPKNMADEIQAYCLETEQPVPESKGAIVRTVLESLALEYRSVSEQIELLTGKAYPVIHIIGGGTQNKLLNQFASNSTGKKVVAGPVEATAIGNILIQAVAMNELSSLDEATAILNRSFDVEDYAPSGKPAWDEAYERYQGLKKGSK
jgi:rhamnulokinase